VTQPTLEARGELTSIATRYGKLPDLRAAMADDDWERRQFPCAGIGERNAGPARGHDTEVRFTHARRERNKIDWPSSRPTIKMSGFSTITSPLAASRDSLTNSDIFLACVKRTSVSWPLDADAIVSHDVQAFCPCVGMRSNNRMHHRRIVIYLLLSGRNGALATGEIEYSTSPSNPVPDRIR
jgi:hypothetical protein